MNRQRTITGLILILSWVISPCAISSSDEINQALEHEPNIENGRKIYPLCASCHLEDGMGKKNGSFPVIAGQHRKVLIKQLADIRARNRQNPTMYPFSDPATIGSVQSITDVTAYIASLPVVSKPGVGKGDYLELGKIFTSSVASNVTVAMERAIMMPFSRSCRDSTMPIFYGSSNGSSMVIEKTAIR